MKSALFVDFDNVYTQLRQLQPAAAERFARQPTEWLRWLVQTLPIPDSHPEPAARRRVLVRRCYLNPNWYQGYRHAFLRAGFEIVDCPPVTAQGKTSTDIHLVLDTVELLAHETRYDEFIVLSADADFTPLLRKLRRYDRRTTVLAIGFPSAAYQASADLLIDERVFIEQALGLVGDEPEAGPPMATAPAASPNGPSSATSSATSSSPSATPSSCAASAPRWVDAPPSAAAAAAAAAAEGLPPPQALAAPGALSAAPLAPLRLATGDELARVTQRIAHLVALSPQPVPAGQLAARLRAEFAPLLDQWNGQANFKSFFRTLGLDQLLWITGSGGRIADPQRHTMPASGPQAEAEPDGHWQGHEALFPLVREVSALTGAPLLPPQGLRAILDLLCEDLARQPYEPTETAQRIVAQCPARCGLAVGMREVVFILRGMQLNGHSFDRGPNDRATLVQRLQDQMLFLCQREQLLLDEPARAQLRQWIGAEPAAGLGAGFSAEG